MVQLDAERVSVLVFPVGVQVSMLPNPEPLLQSHVQVALPDETCQDVYAGLRFEIGNIPHHLIVNDFSPKDAGLLHHARGLRQPAEHACWASQHTGEKSWIRRRPGRFNQRPYGVLNIRLKRVHPSTVAGFADASRLKADQGVPLPGLIPSGFSQGGNRYLSVSNPHASCQTLGDDMLFAVCRIVAEQAPFHGVTGPVTSTVKSQPCALQRAVICAMMLGGVSSVIG